MLKLYNTLTRSIEEFSPLNPQEVTMYSCGPTVYDYQHIGHMRRYVGDDILARALKLNGFRVKRVMNITDVGHLVSDSDEGEDKMEKGARKFGMSVWDIANMFEKQFIESCEALIIEKPTLLMHATDYIKEQIGLIKVLEEKRFTYQINDGIYFDTSKFPGYTELSRQNEDALKAGARVKMTEGKKNATDFALWKFDEKALKGFTPNRLMSWWFDGPYSGKLFDTQTFSKVEKLDEYRKISQTIGFPGWHIECSAMSLEGLFNAFHEGSLLIDKVQTIDIHTGGIDHIAIHHTNEIAQSEVATGKQFVQYWVHHNFLQVNGEKMSKSLGNFYTVQDVIDKGFDPMALRYVYLQTHYRQEMNFTWESLEAAERGLHRLRGEISKLPISADFLPQGEENNLFILQFLGAVNDDMNMAKALSVVWELLKSDVADEEKLNTIARMDNVLGLELFTSYDVRLTPDEIPDNVIQLVQKREEFRKQKDYKKSDELRDEIKNLGYEVTDAPSGPEITTLKK